MATKCKCKSTDSGGTKCPDRHLALCITGKDRKCYGECIPIPNEYAQFSEYFQQWSLDEVNKSIANHLSKNAQLYSYDTDYKEDPSKSKIDFEREEIHMRRVYKNSDNDEIIVNYSVNFDDRINPLDVREREIQ